MKILKWMLLFAVAFIFAWILIFTFTQEQFKQLAAARILAYWTPPIPIYLYVAGAFGIGLLLGLFAAFYYYIVLQRRVHQSTRELQAVEEKLVETRRSLESVESTSVPMDELPGSSYDEEIEDEPFSVDEEPENPGDTDNVEDEKKDLP
jgi:hypothetical protein